MSNNRRWIAGYLIVVSLWALVFLALLRSFITHQRVLVDSLDISLFTTPLLAFNLMFVVISMSISVMYLIMYPKAIKKQEVAKQRLQSELFSKYSTQKYDEDYQFLQDDLCSIIIPAHNEETVIRNTIMNVLLQTYENIEIIVVCHNCKDGTYARSKEVTDSRVHAFEYSTKESGKGIALNYGVSMSKGKYLMILDGDAKLNKTFIEDALPMFHVGNYAAVQGRYIPSNRDYNFITQMLALEGDLWSTPFMTVRSMDGRTPLGGTGYIIKKSILLEVGGFSNHLVDDYELTFRLLRKKHRIVFAPLSINYDEKPPSLEIMVNQRGRWIRGFFNLLTTKVAETRDIISTLYTVNPLSAFTNLALLIISAYDTLYYMGFHYYPYHFSYISANFWIEMCLAYMGVNSAVILRQYGRQGLKYVALLPVHLLFSNYYMIVSFKALFIKSWAESKTLHGFVRENLITKSHSAKKRQ